MNKTILLFILMCSSCGYSSEEHWMHVIPDQSDSQEVEINSIGRQGNEWVAWTRSFLLVSSEIPDGINPPPGTAHHVQMAITCKLESIAVRALSHKFIGPDGTVLYESDKGIESIYPGIDGLEYSTSTPGLICAAALSKKSGKELSWPMRKSELRMFIQSAIE